VARLTGCHSLPKFPCRSRSETRWTQQCGWTKMRLESSFTGLLCSTNVLDWSKKLVFRVRKRRTAASGVNREELWDTMFGLICICIMWLSQEEAVRSQWRNQERHKTWSGFICEV
jgi:hypothetical protein